MSITYPPEMLPLPEDGQGVEIIVDGKVYMTIDPDSPPPPLCVWCSAPWTNDMMKVYAEADTSQGYYDETSIDAIAVTIDVTCSTCKRLVYQKHIRDAQS